MTFELDCPVPELSQTPDFKPFEDGQDWSLGEYFQEILAWCPEQRFAKEVTMIWNGIRIPLEYRYDVAIILEEIVDELLLPVMANKEGHRSFGWPSDTFRTDWTVSWKNEDVIVVAQWHSLIRRGPDGELEAKLNAQPRIEVNKAYLVSQWQQLLVHLVHAARQFPFDPARFDLWPRLLKAAGIQE